MRNRNEDQRPDKNRAIELIKEAIALWTWRLRPKDEIETAAHNEYLIQGLGTPSMGEISQLMTDAAKEKAALRERLKMKGLVRGVVDEEAVQEEIKASIQGPPVKKKLHTVFDYDNEM